MIKRTVAIIAVVIVVVAVVIVGVYLATQSGLGGSSNPSPTPSATPTPTGTATTSPSPTSGGNVAGASSLKYSVSVTEGLETQGYTYQVKNAGTSNVMLRIDYTDTSGVNTIILNGAEMKAWSFSNGAWQDISATYSTQFNVWNSLYQGYVGSLSTWTGGDWTYTSGGTTVRIYDISVNPSIPDSVFQPT